LHSARGDTIRIRVPPLGRYAKPVVVAAVALVVTALAPSALAQSAPACGQVVTESVRLTESLTECATGLVVGADGITIDLGGHAVQGVAAAGSIGIDVTGRSGVTVRNGRVRGFDTGVRFFNSSGSTLRAVSVRDTSRGISLVTTSGAPPAAANQVVGNLVTNSNTGIFMFGSWDRVAGNALLENSGPGILCRDGGGSQVGFNLVSRNGSGIELFFCRADLSANIASENLGHGIARIRAFGAVRNNIASGNGGDGIFSDDSPAVFASNVTIANRGNGLSIFDVIPTSGPLYAVTGHLAIANRGYGIFTPLEGVIDGGNNRARGNGAAVQ
jgi:hypothetical protein